LVALIIANTASEMVYTLLPVYLLDLGATPAQIGMVFTGGMLFVAVLQFFGGYISDRIGRLRAIAVGSLIATAGYLGFWIAPSWIWILPAICLEFVSVALVGPSFSALIADQSSPEQRGRTFGTMRSFLMTVTIIAPVLGGYLAASRSFSFVLGVSFFMYLSASLLRIWLAWRYPPPPKPVAQEPVLPSLFHNLKSLLSLAVGGGILTWIVLTDGGRDLAFNISSDLLPVYLTTVLTMGVVQIGLFRTLRGWATVMSSLAAGWLSDRFGERQIIVAGFLLEALGLLLMLQAHTMLELVPAALFFGIGLGMLFPAFDSLISKVIPENMRGSAFGLLDSSRNMLAIPGPMIGGELMQNVSPSLPFILTAAINLLCAAGAWFKLHLPFRKEEDIP